jgi:Xaa-Pro aminopeptidase
VAIASMVTILHRGFSSLDRAALPEDEYYVRRVALQEHLLEADLKGVFVFSDPDDYADAAYLGGTLDGATVYLPAIGDPTLLGGPHAWREQCVLRGQTWIRDFRVQGSFPSATAALRSIVDEHSLVGNRVGVCGLARTQSPAAQSAAGDALGDCELICVDDLLRRERRQTRPRELVVLRTALGIAQAAAAAGIGAYTAGATNAEAAVAAELTARSHRARDVRLLVNLAGSGLRPLETIELPRRDRLSLYVAVDYQGYWAEAIATSPLAPEDELALAAVTSAAAHLRAGVSAGELADAATAALPASTLDTALSHGLGGGMGLTPTDDPPIVPGSSAAFAPGAAVSLRAVVPRSDGPGLACVALVATGDGSEPLAPIAPPAECGREQ